MSKKRKKTETRWQWPSLAVSLPAQTLPDARGLASSYADILGLWRELGYEVSIPQRPTPQTPLIGQKQARGRALLWGVLAIVLGLSAPFIAFLALVFLLAARA